MKHLEFIKFVIGLFLLSLPIITGLLFFNSLIVAEWVPLFKKLSLVSHTTLIYISACGFIGAYLLNSIKN